jgi:hypothetical protein
MGHLTAKYPAPRISSQATNNELLTNDTGKRRLLQDIKKGRLLKPSYPGKIGRYKQLFSLAENINNESMFYAYRFPPSRSLSTESIRSNQFKTKQAG